MHVFSFEKLEVWELAKDFAISIYRLTKKFPDYEKYGLISQLNRAAISIPTNITEGSGRIGSKDKANFTNIANSSLLEVLNLLIISEELNFITEKELIENREKIEIISQKLSSLRKSQINSKPINF